MYYRLAALSISVILFVVAIVDSILHLSIENLKVKIGGGRGRGRRKGGGRKRRGRCEKERREDREET